MQEFGLTRLSLSEIGNILKPLGNEVLNLIEKRCDDNREDRQLPNPILLEEILLPELDAMNPINRDHARYAKAQTDTDFPHLSRKCMSHILITLGHKTRTSGIELSKGLFGSMPIEAVI